MKLKFSLYSVEEEVQDELAMYTYTWQRQYDILIRQEELLTERLIEMGYIPTEKFIREAETGLLDDLENGEKIEIGENQNGEKNEDKHEIENGKVTDLYSNSNGHENGYENGNDTLTTSSATATATATTPSLTTVNLISVNQTNTPANLNTHSNTIIHTPLQKPKNPENKNSENKIPENSKNLRLSEDKIREKYDLILRNKRANQTWIEEIVDEPLDEEILHQNIELARYVHCIDEFA